MKWDDIMGLNLPTLKFLPLFLLLPTLSTPFSTLVLNMMSIQFMSHENLLLPHRILESSINNVLFQYCEVLLIVLAYSMCKKLITNHCY